MRRQPLLILLICFMLGIWLQDEIALPAKTVNILFSLAVALLAVILVRNFWTQKFRHFSLGLLFFTAGLFSLTLHSKENLKQEFSGRQEIVFQLDKKLNSNEKYRRYEVDVLRAGDVKANTEQKSFKAVLALPREAVPLDFVHYYRTEAYVNLVEAPDNDFQFNYARYLARKNIHHQIFANGEVMLAPQLSVPLSRKIRQMRLDILTKIDHSLLSSRPKEFLKGIILADRTEMDAQTVMDFNRSGLVHLLAISGSHMVIIFMLIMFVMQCLLPPSYRRWAIVTSLLIIWFFAIFIDYGSSVVRSCIMISTYYIYVILQRKPDLLHAMALAAFIILIADPHQLFDVGFQLSFAAVLGIYWLNAPILDLFGRRGNWLQRFLTNILSISLSAQLATLPLVLYYFHQYSPISIVANLVIIPFTEIIIISSIAMTFLLAMNFNVGFINSIYSGAVEILLKVIHSMAGAEKIFMENIPFSLAEVAAFSLIIYFSRFLIIKKDLRAALNFTLALLCFILVRTGININSAGKDELLVANNFKDEIVIAKDRCAAVFYVPKENKMAAVEKSVVKPYVTSRRIRQFEIRPMPKDSQIALYKGRQIALGKAR